MNLIYEIANTYVDFSINGKRIHIPYCIVGQVDNRHPFINGRTTKNRNFGAKGSVSQIKDALLHAAAKEHFNIDESTPDEINHFMIEEGIGIDCSGFVYNILDTYLKKTKHVLLDSLILRFPGLMGRIERWLLRKNRVRRSSAATLTSSLNTVPIEKVKDMQPGDMIRLTHSDWEGKHIVIIIDVTKDYILYANSSEYTKIQGPHFGKIKIIDKDKGLDEQKWEEVTQEGKNYGEDAYSPKRGDGVKRLKFLFASK